jgi:PAS domain S-box-containing protein
MDEVAGMTPSALLDALFANARLGLAAWDRDLRYVRVNDVLAAMNGVPADAHVGRRVPDVLPDLGPRLEALMRRLIETGEPLRDVEISGETPAAPGVERHWLASYFPVRDEEGEIVGISATVVEVTGERRAVERERAALRASESVDAQLRAVYTALPMGVAFLTPDLRYQRVNEALARMNGRSVEAHIGATLEEVLGEPAGHIADLLRQVARTREPLEFEAEFATPGADCGEETTALEATYFPVLDDAGALLGLGGVVRDVSERHRMQAEQSRLLLEALTARAQAEAAQVRSRSALEEAEQARRDAERARRQTAFLASTTTELASSMDYEAALRTLVSSAVPTVADWCVVTVVDPGGALRVLAVATADPALEALAWELAQEYRPAADNESGTPKVLRTGAIDVQLDITQEEVDEGAEDARQLELLRALGVRHVVTAPLQTPSGTLGTLGCMLGHSGRRFTPEDVELVGALASRAALHLNNARLYTERSRIAEDLQESLRPRQLPVIPGVELAGRYRAAGRENEVGGDFYDVFPTDDDAWTAVVGDVSGKGSEAAALTALVRHSLRAASMLGVRPAAALELVNRLLLADPQGSRFCTVVYARMRRTPGTLRLRFANGGHMSPLLLRADGQVERVETGRGPLVGGVAGLVFREDTLELAPGDLVLLYTDGVTEVSRRDLDFGERDLRETLRAHTGASAEAVVAAVEARAVALQDGEPRDDIAVIAIRALGDPSA